ncbi:hypothetical protein [Bradyrhizobium sp.]
MTLTTSADWAYFLAICGVMGITGQLVRAIGGLKKVNDEAATMEVKFADAFEWPVFLTPIATGFAAGIIAGLSIKPDEITTQFLLGVLAAGYSGADFIAAFMKKSLPDVQKAASASAAKALSFDAFASKTLSLRTSISDAVKYVIADSKKIDLSEVSDEKKLSSLSFDETDCIALERNIDLYFFNVLGLQFDKLLFGTKAITRELTVEQVIDKVNSLHPRPRF